MDNPIFYEADDYYDRNFPGDEEPVNFCEKCQSLTPVRITGGENGIDCAYCAVCETIIDNDDNDDIPF